MAAIPSPVEVGAKGTIASLVSQEIEFFQRLDNEKQHKLSFDIGSISGSKQKPSSGCVAAKKKKKTPKSGKFLPSICSAVDVTNTVSAERIAGIGYRNLRTDGEKLPQD